MSEKSAVKPSNLPQVIDWSSYFFNTDKKNNKSFLTPKIRGIWMDMIWKLEQCGVLFYYLISNNQFPF